MLSIPGHKRMQVESRLRFHLIPVRLAIIKNTNNKCWRGCVEKGILTHCKECKLVKPLWKTIFKVLKTLNHRMGRVTCSSTS
jgi:hypothetical protein